MKCGSEGGSRSTLSSRSAQVAVIIIVILRFRLPHSSLMMPVGAADRIIPNKGILLTLLQPPGAGCTSTWLERADRRSNLARYREQFASKIAYGTTYDNDMDKIRAGNVLELELLDSTLPMWTRDGLRMSG